MSGEIAGELVVTLLCIVLVGLPVTMIVLTLVTNWMLRSVRDRAAARTALSPEVADEIYRRGIGHLIKSQDVREHSTFLLKSAAWMLLPVILVIGMVHFLPPMITALSDGGQAAPENSGVFAVITWVLWAVIALLVAAVLGSGVWWLIGGFTSAYRHDQAMASLTRDELRAARERFDAATQHTREA